MLVKIEAIGTARTYPCRGMLRTFPSRSVCVIRNRPDCSTKKLMNAARTFYSLVSRGGGGAARHVAESRCGDAGSEQRPTEIV